MTKEEKRPVSCVLRLFGASEQAVQQAAAALPEGWQGTVSCRSRGAETLVALQSESGEELCRAAQTALEMALRLAQGKTPAGTQVLAESAQHDPTALTALDETLRAE